MTSNAPVLLLLVDIFNAVGSVRFYRILIGP